MEDDVCRVIAEALEVKKVLLSDSMDTISSWDSMGMLNILMALEDAYGEKVASISELSEVRSVDEIIKLLRRESIIS